MTIPRLEPFDDDDEDEEGYDDESRRCSHCAGDGWVECRNPLECTRPHNKFGECPCGSCGGSGDAKDMTVW